MRKTTVQKHVGQELIHMEIAGLEEMQTKQRIQVDAAALQHIGGQESQYVDDQQIFGHSRHIVHSCRYQLIS